MPTPAEKLQEIAAEVPENQEKATNQITGVQTQITEKQEEQAAFEYSIGQDSTTLLAFLATKGDYVYTMDSTHYTGIIKYYYNGTSTTINTNLKDWQVFDYIENGGVSKINNGTFLSSSPGLYNIGDTVYFLDSTGSSMEVSAVGDVLQKTGSDVTCTMTYSIIPDNLGATLDIVYEYEDHDIDSTIDGWDDSTTVTNIISSSDYAVDQINQEIGITTGSYGIKALISLLQDGKDLLQKNLDKLNNGTGFFNKFG